MRQINLQLNPQIVNNIQWFLASLGLSVLVWLIASTQADPIESQDFDRVPVMVQVDEGLQVITTISPVTVTVRAPESVLDNVRVNEIVVTADLQGVSAGEYANIPLSVDILRSRANGETSAVIASIVVEEIQSKLVAIEPIVDADLPPDYEYSDIALNDVEVQVTGASGAVSQVDGVQLQIRLRDQRATFEDDFALVAVNADGQTVSGVTLEPASTHVTVTINRSSNVRAVSIIPDIDADSLPDGYNFVDVEYSPQTVFVQGDLDALPDVLYTQPIDLTNRLEDFEMNVAVLPPDDFLILGNGRVSVTVNIAPATVREQFEGVPVVAIGANPDLLTRIAPETVAVSINIPQADADQISLEDIRVVVDVTNLDVNTYELEPIVTISIGNIPEENISVLPATISVTISELAEVTPEASEE